MYTFTHPTLVLKSFPLNPFKPYLLGVYSQYMDSFHPP